MGRHAYAETAELLLSHLLEQKAGRIALIIGASSRVSQLIPEAYADYARPIFAEFANPVLTTKEADVSQAVWLAATDGSDQLHYPAGADALALA